MPPPHIEGWEDWRDAAHRAFVKDGMGGMDAFFMAHSLLDEADALRARSDSASRRVIREKRLAELGSCTVPWPSMTEGAWTTHPSGVQSRMADGMEQWFVPERVERYGERLRIFSEPPCEKWHERSFEVGRSSPRWWAWINVHGFGVRLGVVEWIVTFYRPGGE